MSDLANGAAQAVSGLKAQSMRLRLVSENIANADTPGYHRKLTSFEEVVKGGRVTGEVSVGKVQLDLRQADRVYDPSHPLAGEDGTYEGSNVELVVEIADAREAQRSYEANLRMFDQTRQMSRSLLELLRK